MQGRVRFSQAPEGRYVAPLKLEQRGLRFFCSFYRYFAPTELKLTPMLILSYSLFL